VEERGIGNRDWVVRASILIMILGTIAIHCGQR
jgi:hypothetical protein